MSTTHFLFFPKLLYVLYAHAFVWPGWGHVLYNIIADRWFTESIEIYPLLQLYILQAFATATSTTASATTSATAAQADERLRVTRVIYAVDCHFGYVNMRVFLRRKERKKM